MLKGLAGLSGPARNKGEHMKAQLNSRRRSFDRISLLGQRIADIQRIFQLRAETCLLLITTSVAVLFSGAAAYGSTIPLGSADMYAVLYEGTGGHNLSISNVTINGNVGVGGTGVVQFSGPGTIDGRLDFSSANVGQYNNTNGMNVGPTSVNYSVVAVTNALNKVNNLSSSFVGLGK